MKIERKTNSTRPAYALGAAMIAAAMVLGGCTTKPEETSEVMLEGDVPMIESDYGSGTVDGFEYTILRSQEYGPELEKGWYIRDTDYGKYILICDGMKPSGGYYIDISDISYDPEKDIVLITVTTSRDRSVVTDALTYPTCSVSFDKLPDNVVVVYDYGDSVGFAGYIESEEGTYPIKIKTYESEEPAVAAEFTTFTMFSTIPDKEKSEQNEIRTLIAQKTGVQVIEVWEEGQYSRNVIDGLLQAGTFTDFIYVSGRLDDFYGQGVLVAWDDYLEQYPNIKALYTDEEWDKLRQEDGHIYSVNIPGAPLWIEAEPVEDGITNKAGFAITTNCKDPDAAFRFIDDILSEEIMDLRIWGIEGVDYLVNEDGLFYRTGEMTDNWNNDEYRIEHVCGYSMMPVSPSYVGSVE